MTINDSTDAALVARLMRGEVIGTNEVVQAEATQRLKSLKKIVAGRKDEEQRQKQEEKRRQADFEQLVVLAAEACALREKHLAQRVASDEVIKREIAACAARNQARCDNRAKFLAVARRLAPGVFPTFTRTTPREDAERERGVEDLMAALRARRVNLIGIETSQGLMHRDHLLHFTGSEPRTDLRFKELLP